MKDMRLIIDCFDLLRCYLSMNDFRPYVFFLRDLHFSLLYIVVSNQFDKH